MEGHCVVTCGGGTPSPRLSEPVGRQNNGNMCHKPGAFPPYRKNLKGGTIKRKSNMCGESSPVCAKIIIERPTLE